MARWLARATSFVAGAGLACVAAYGAFLSWFHLILSAQKPDPRIPDGDPCCSHPDSWAAVIGGVAGSIVYLSISGLVMSLAATVLWWSLRGVRPRARPALFFGVGVIVVPVAGLTAWVGLLE